MSYIKPPSLRTCLQNLDESQKLTLRKLRNILKDELRPDDDDFLLLRFLKARNFDLAKAEKMLREHFKFRKTVEQDMKDYKPHELLEEYTSWDVLGNDKDGDPISYYVTFAHDFKGIAYSVALPEQTKYVLYILNEQYKISKKGKHEVMGTFICDLDGISPAFISSELVLRQHLAIIRLYLANFPETLKTCYLINAPSYFPFLFNIYKNMLDPSVVEKIRIFGKDGYQDALLTDIDADVLPVCLGGTRTDPDGNPECLTLFRRKFLKIPTSCYLNSEDMQCYEPGVNDICIKERASYDYRVRVDTKNTILKWYFRTIKYNIKFGVFYVSDQVPQTPKLNRKHAKVSGKTLEKVGYEPVFPIEPIESHVMPERGEYVCDKIGTYVFRFDNTFSWVTPKELSFKVEVTLPTEDSSTPQNGYHRPMETEI